MALSAENPFLSPVTEVERHNNDLLTKQEREQTINAYNELRRQALGRAARLTGLLHDVAIDVATSSTASMLASVYETQAQITTLFEAMDKLALQLDKNANSELPRTEQ